MTSGRLIALALCLGASAGARAEAPYPLSETELDAVLDVPRAWFDDGAHSGPGGIGARLEAARWGTLVVAVRADRRLNLYLGEPNDLTSGHGGALFLDVESVSDASGRELYQPEREHPWGARVVVAPGDEPWTDGSRSVPVAADTQGESAVATVRGSWRVETPVDLAEVRIAADGAHSPHPLLEKVIFDGSLLTVFHPEPAPRAIVTVLGFDGDGDRVPVVGQGYTGKAQENHWYRFERGRAVRLVRLWIAGAIETRERSFRLDAR